MPSPRSLVLQLFMLVMLTASPAGATTVSFEAVDLSDVVIGEDLWSYAYDVSGFSFTTNTGFSIYFDAGLYEQLEDPPPPVNGDWDALVLQPEPIFSVDGLYDALALVDDPSLANPFTLTFVWLGAPGTTPGSQPFDVHEFDSQGNFVGILDSGTTVPEPTTAVLLSTGLCALSSRRARALNPARA